MPKLVRWLTGDQAPRIPGFVEEVEDHVAESFLARKLVELVEPPSAPVAAVLDEPTQDRQVKRARRKA